MVGILVLIPCYASKEIWVWTVMEKELDASVLTFGLHMPTL
jgi:hypothetical protein